MPIEQLPIGPFACISGDPDLFAVHAIVYFPVIEIVFEAMAYMKAKEFKPGSICNPYICLEHPAPSTLRLGKILYPTSPKSKETSGPVFGRLPQIAWSLGNVNNTIP
jgi:hypothetical protein